MGYGGFHCSTINRQTNIRGGETEVTLTSLQLFKGITKDLVPFGKFNRLALFGLEQIVNKYPIFRVTFQEELPAIPSQG